MGFFDRFRRKKKPTELPDYFSQEDDSTSEQLDDFIEEVSVVQEETIPVSEEKEYTYVKVLHLYGLSDVTLIENELKEKNIVIADITPLKQSSNAVSVELKRTVEQLRGITKIQDGDIAQLGDKYILLTPSGVKIWRRRTEAEE
ncbi:MAG: cell division protein SepF [Candidatus Odinarchaeia archaeon]